MMRRETAQTTAGAGIRARQPVRTLAAVMATVIAVAVLLAACGGDDGPSTSTDTSQTATGGDTGGDTGRDTSDDTGRDTSDDTGRDTSGDTADGDAATDTSGDAESAGQPSGPIDGLLVVQPSFGFGLWEVDAASATAQEFAALPGVESLDRNSDLVVGGGAAYALGGTLRDGQSYSSDISVVRADYATGKIAPLAELGFDREADDSTDTNSYRIEAVAGDRVLVSSGAFGAEERTMTVYDAATGDTAASYPAPFYEFSDDTTSCSGNVANLVGLSDGRVAGTALGSPAFVDIDTGEVDLVVLCGDPDPQLSDYVTPETVQPFAVVNEGQEPTAEQFERLLNTDLDPEYGFVEGDGDLWWLVADTRSYEDVQVILGGVVQFDLATRQIEAVHPLGSYLGEYIDCVPDGDRCELSTLGPAELGFVDGRVVIVDTRDNGPVLTLDPASGEVTATIIELGEGVDYTNAYLLAGRPGEAWLEVRRFTYFEQDSDSRTASGPTYFERLDPTTGTIDASLKVEDLIS